MKHKRIRHDEIVRAKHGDTEAMYAILQHYERYIAHFSKRRVTDEYGNLYVFIDKDISERIESKLMFSIIFKFDLESIPPELLTETTE